MANFVMQGLPTNVVLHRLVSGLNILFAKYNMRNVKFRVTSLSDIPDISFKEAVIEVEPDCDIPSVFEALTTFIYKDGKLEYTVCVEKCNERSHMSNNERRSRGRDSHGMYTASSDRYHSRTPVYYDTMYHAGSDRARSRSPMYNRGSRMYRTSPNRHRSRSPLRMRASQLDMELELLKKQRQVIEEERRLLLEQKKLDLVKEYGHGALKELDHYKQRQRGDDYYRRREDYYQRPRARSPPRKTTRKIAPKKRSSIPRFVLPCRFLIEEMNPAIVKMKKPEITPAENKILVNLIRSTIRKRIAVALEGKEYVGTREIVKMYRGLYPKHLDDKLVDNLIKSIRDSHLPGQSSFKKVEGNQEAKEVKTGAKMDKKGVEKDGNETLEAKNQETDPETKPDTECLVIDNADETLTNDVEIIQVNETEIIQIDELENDDDTAEVKNINDEDINQILFEDGTEWNESEQVE